MRSIIDLLLKIIIVVDLIIMIAIFLHNYLDISWVPAPGRRLNNPLGGLLLAILILGWVNEALRTRGFSKLKTCLTSLPQKYYFFGFLLFAILFLEAMHLLSAHKSYWDLNIEKGYGTYFSTLQLFILGVSVLIISREKAQEENPVPKIWEWIVFAGIFLFISFDEVFGIHDKIGVEVAGTFIKWPALNSVFVWLWVYAPLILGAIAFFLRFFLRIAGEFRTARNYFFAGLACWIVAIAFEAMARTSPYPRFLLIAVEEGLEMLGATLFLMGVGVCLKKAEEDSRQTMEKL